jgi:hyperosmotically inducible protein
MMRVDKRLQPLKSHAPLDTGEPKTTHEVSNVPSQRMRLRSLQFFAAAVVAMALAVPGYSFGQDQSTPPAATSPDNSANNKAQTNTADQQSEASADRMLTQKIRKAIIADKSLSMYGHNVKIIAKDGAVTLKGPVHTDDEKQAIGSIAANAAGGPDKVTNDLTVKQ